MKNNRNKAIRRISAVVFVMCLILLGQAYLKFVQHRTQQAELKEMKTAGTVAYPLQGSAAPRKPAVLRTEGGRESSGVQAKKPMATSYRTLQPLPEDQTQTASSAAVQAAAAVADADILSTSKIMEQYAALHETNHDLTGWLSIEGMKIDYPVMQGTDDEYYLHHDFYGKESKYGCLYVKTCADVETGTNFIIYGHNMKDGSMFGDLDFYLEESFYREHPAVSFDTLYEERTYDIVAVFRSQVYNEEDNVFKYYQFYEADTQEEFDDFYRNIKELSLYDTGVEAQYGDTFLTLSTCAYHVQDGRLVVVAKRRTAP